MNGDEEGCGREFALDFEVLLCLETEVRDGAEHNSGWNLGWGIVASGKWQRWKRNKGRQSGGNVSMFRGRARMGKRS